MKDSDMSQYPNEPKNYISNIYEYCDQWCNKCPFTDRCSMYETSRKIVEDDKKNPWEDIRKI